MDKNQATGLILFAAVILTYSIFFATTPEIPPVETTISADSTNTTTAVAATTLPTAGVPDSLLDLERQRKFGDLAPFTLGEEKPFVLENEVVKITLSNKGGSIKEVLLKKYTSWKNEPLYLLDSAQTSLNYSIDTRLGTVNLNDLYFVPALSSADVEGVKQQTVTFTASSPAGQLIQKYTLKEGEYTLEKNFEIQGLEGIVTAKAVRIDWKDEIKSQEKDLAESRRKTQVNYYLAEGTYTCKMDRLLPTFLYCRNHCRFCIPRSKPEPKYTCRLLTGSFNERKPFPSYFRRSGKPQLLFWTGSIQNPKSNHPWI
jgi:YidC/Oxa1 family membrane protein insertase